jgi:hypothetical protein
MPFEGFRKIRCPFCANEYRLSDFAIYSETESRVIKDAAQTPLQRISRGIRVDHLQGHKSTLGRYLRQCPNPACQQSGSRGLLPLNIEYVEENITIAVVGDTFAGKSHFIAAMIQNLKERRIPTAFGLNSFLAAASSIELRYRQEYYDPLFKRGEVLLPNQQASSPIDQPLIYEMHIGGRIVNLLIYDASGEDFANIDINVQNKPHILNARALIFLADPWAMPGFVDQLAFHLRPDTQLLTGRMAADVLTNVIAIFKRAMGEMTNPRFSLPVAIALAKSDLIPYVVTQSGNPLYRALADPQYPSTFDRNETGRIHEVVRQFLYEVNEVALASMEQSIESVNFSAISATGGPANQGRYSQQIVPHRCLDPLVWVLRELDVVP